MLFDCWRILRLNRDKPVRDDVTQEERRSWTLAEIRPLFRSDKFLPVYRSEFIKGAENFAG